MDGSAPAASPLTPLAVQNETLLRAISTGPHDSLTALANAAQVLVGNVNRKLEALQNEGLIAYPDGAQTCEPALTDAGRATLDALDRAANPALSAAPAPPATNAVRLRYDQLRPDPDNARTHSGLAGEEFEGLVASVREKGILTRIEVRAPDALGIHTILKGERRWRAWGRMLSEGRWSADHLEEVVVVEGDDEHLTEVAIIDNVQRADLDNLEKAEAYFKLHRRFGRSPQDIAARIGTTDRHVQELLRVGEKASAEARAAYWEAKTGGVANAWTTLRDSVKTPKHLVELERNARLRLLVIELACRSAAENGCWDEYVDISRPPPGGVLSTALDLELARVDWSTVGKVRARLDDLAGAWLAELLGGGDDANPLLAEARTAALGPMGAAAVAEGRWGVDFLNPPPPPPTPTTATEPPPSGSAAGEAGGPSAEAAPAPAHVRGAGVGFVGDEFSRQIRDAARDDDEGDAAPPAAQTPAEPAPPAEPPAPELLPPTLELTGKKRLAIVEIAHKTAHHGAETRGGQIRGAPVAEFHRHALAMELLNDGLVAFNQDAASTGYLAVLSQKALDWLANEGFGEGVAGRDVENARFNTLTQGELAALAADETPIDCATRYATPWLNVAPRKKEAAPPKAPPPPDPVMKGFRTAFVAIHTAGENAAAILARLISGEGAGDDELQVAIDALRAALDGGKPYLPKDGA